jgi:uncharacterized protein DUF4351
MAWVTLLVLYNGVGRWQAPEEVAELVATVPGGWERYRPCLRYFLLDEGRFTEDGLAPLRNLAAALFRLENSRTPADVQRVLRALIDWLKAPEQRHLRRAFTVWLKRVFLPGRVPGRVFDELQDLQEVEAMLAERVKEWAEEWKRQGLQEGIQEGLQQGEAAIVLRLLERRFGALDETVRQRIQAADAETLLLWGERVLTVQVLADVFEA